MDPTGEWDRKESVNFKNRTIEITHSEQQRELDWKKLTAFETGGTRIKDLIFVLWESREEMRKGVGLKK